MVKHNWGVNFYNTSNLTFFPELQLIYQSDIWNSEYSHSGADRQLEQNSVFQYTLAGSGMFCDGKVIRAVQSGQGFLINLNDPLYRYFYPEKSEDVWSVLWCQFSSGLVSSQVSEINRNYGYIFDLPRQSQIIKQLLSFQQNGEHQQNLDLWESSRIVTELLSALIESKEQTRLKGAGEILVKKALLIINTRQEQLFKIKELANECQVTREYLSRVFMQQLNVSPYQYILASKIESVKLELRFSSLSIKEIAYQYGFSSHVHMSTVFKSRTGFCPMEYRRRG